MTPHDAATLQGLQAELSTHNGRDCGCPHKLACENREEWLRKEIARLTPALTAPHDAATRERVAAAIAAAQGYQWSILGPSARDYFMTSGDAALSALQPQPKGWEVSGKSLGAFNAAHDSAGGNLLNRRMCAMRAAVPHLLRDLADGVSADALMDAWQKVNEAPYDGALLRRFLRALADTLEGHDGHPNRSAS